MRRVIRLSVVVLLATTGTALAVPPAYPPPHKPIVTPRPVGPFRTLKVSPRGPFKTIMAAVRRARAGDTIKVGDGVYRQGGVLVQGSSKAYLKIVGDIADPSRVVLDGKGLHGAAAQNAILVNGAGHVTLEGITAQRYKADGFFFTGVNSYTASKLRALEDGTYGIYAFNSVGGTMTDDVAAWNNDSGIYIGQTPAQVRPVPSIVSNVMAYGNVRGFSGANMRYVTITKSKWFDNSTGIGVAALHSEKYAPPEDNTIINNDVFWNNFDYYKGAPFRVPRDDVNLPPFPVGVGILLFGGRTTAVTENRIFGNYLAGGGLLQQVLLTQEPGSQDLIGDSVTNNAFGANGADLNGRDIVYDGNGIANCFSANTGVLVTVPADASTMAPCPYTAADAFSAAAQQTLISWATAPDHEANWITHPHSPQAGLTPLQDYATYTGQKPPT